MQWKFTSHCLQPLLLPLQNISRTWSLLLQGSSLQVEILSIRLFVRLSVITSHCLPYSDSKFAQPPPVDLSHVTSPTVSNVPIHVSHSRQSTGPPSQSTGPPMNISIWGRFMCQLDICFHPLPPTIGVDTSQSLAQRAKVCGIKCDQIHGIVALWMDWLRTQYALHTVLCLWGAFWPLRALCPVFSTWPSWPGSDAASGRSWLQWPRAFGDNGTNMEEEVPYYKDYAVQDPFLILVRLNRNVPGERDSRCDCRHRSCSALPWLCFDRQVLAILDRLCWTGIVDSLLFKSAN